MKKAGKTWRQPTHAMASLVQAGQSGGPKDGFGGLRAVTAGAALGHSG